MLMAAALGVAATWLGILFAYDSFYWIPSSHGLPVSFFIVSLVFLCYLATGIPFVRRGSEWPVSHDVTVEASA